MLALVKATTNVMWTVFWHQVLCLIKNGVNVKERFKDECSQRIHLVNIPFHLGTASFVEKPKGYGLFKITDNPAVP